MTVARPALVRAGVAIVLLALSFWSWSFRGEGVEIASTIGGGSELGVLLDALLIILGRAYYGVVLVLWPRDFSLRQSLFVLLVIVASVLATLNLHRDVAEREQGATEISDEHRGLLAL